MTAFATTKLSSKGQIVIPEEIRDALRLKEGALFMVITQGDAVILKTINPPPLDEVKQLLVDAKAQAKKAKMGQSKIRKAVTAVRKRG